MIERILEPEYMDDPKEAESYDAMDHAEVNAAFADRLIELLPEGGRVLDLGTGTAQIPIAIAARYRAQGKAFQIVAVDAARSMLDVAKRNVEHAGMSDVIRLVLHDAKRRLDVSDEPFDAVVSNSVIHHIADPRPFLREVAGRAGDSGAVLLRDLYRPATIIDLAEKVERIAGREAPQAKELFRASLHAAFTLDEIGALASESGLTGCRVYASSDRHWTIERAVRGAD